MGTCGDEGSGGCDWGSGDGDRTGSRGREWGGSLGFFLLEAGAVAKT